MTLIHWLYALGVIVVVATMILRRNVIIPCIAFTFLIGLVYTGSLTGAASAVFTSGVVATRELFSIFFIIAIMVAMLKGLEATGGDEVMARPLRGFIRSPFTGFVAIIIGTLVFSLLFWPTPAIPLIGVLLIPAAVASGLPPMLCAMALAITGQGMALAADVVIQGAPGLTAKSAGVPVDMVLMRAAVLSLVVGAVALVLAWIMNRDEIQKFKEAGGAAETVFGKKAGELVAGGKYGPISVVLLVIAVVGVIFSLFAFSIRGGDAAGLLGGAVLIVLAIIALLSYRAKGLDIMSDYLGEGLSFAFKVMGPIIPIAGFFFIGSPEMAPAILGKGAPGYLFDIGALIAQVISPASFIGGFGMLVLGVITGLDGSGFSGLPLVGTLSAALAGGNQNLAAGLGAIGQIGAVWSGGGTIVAWSTLVAVAGIAGVPVLDLVRRNFVPVVAGLVVATIVGVLFMM
ncbi:MAG: hypothetical protein ACUVX1_02965 [Chloroflexota bacterium]